VSAGLVCGALLSMPLFRESRAAAEQQNCDWYVEKKLRDERISELTAEIQERDALEDKMEMCVNSLFERLKQLEVTNHKLKAKLVAVTGRSASSMSFRSATPITTRGTSRGGLSAAPDSAAAPPITRPASSSHAVMGRDTPQQHAHAHARGGRGGRGGYAPNPNGGRGDSTDTGAGQGGGGMGGVVMLQHNVKAAGRQFALGEARQRPADVWPPIQTPMHGFADGAAGDHASAPRSAQQNMQPAAALFGPPVLHDDVAALPESPEQSPRRM